MKPTENTPAPVDLAAVRAKLASASGPQFWRSLEEVAATPEFRDIVEHEFPAQADTLTDPLQRRHFLQVMGASLALAGVTGCTKQPQEPIMPYAAQPPEQTPGKPRYFATAAAVNGYGQPILVESHENRPTKIEGNPEHPMSLGKSGIFAQSSILDLYDPDRLTRVVHRGRDSGYRSFLSDLRRQIALKRAQNGAKLCVLTTNSTSPTLGAALSRLTEEMPEARCYRYDAASADGARAGAMAAFGEHVETIYRLEKAKVILSLDADFLNSNAVGSVRMIRDFAAGRRVAAGQADQNRLYVVEPAPSTTGSNADHRLRLKASEVEAFAFALAARLGVAGVSAGDLPAAAEAWVEPLAADLERAGSQAVVIPGEYQPAAVHALAHAINQALGAAGSTVVHSEPLVAAPSDQTAGLKELVAAMNAGEVEALLILGGNPVYSTPGDIDFAAAMEQVGFIVYLGSHDDETGYLSHWQLPASHYLETWGDIRAADGQVTIQQPLIAELYNSRSELELISAALGDERSGYELIREYWSERLGLEGAEFENAWRRILHDGVVPNSAPAAKQVTLSGDLSLLERSETGEGTELVLRPDASASDGRYANNGWLMELPRPISRVTWENPVLVSPATAEQMGLQNGEIVELAAHDRTAAGPVWIVPGQADDVIVATLGYGRTRSGRVGSGAGFDAYPLQDSAARWSTPAVAVTKTRESKEVACVQDHGSMEGRGLIQIAAAADYREHPNFAQEHGHGPAHEAEYGVGADYVGKSGRPRSAEELGAGFQKGRTQGVMYNETENPLSLYPEYEYGGNAWGLTIDLNACVGCNACMAACQSENNIPVVGREQVLAGREMHWIRIDRYFEGSVDDPATLHQPLTCMQCENAPCEPVCPVGATVHSAEGLNDMVYNRCVGTRYCSNNCPYKVRRFNFLLYQDFETESIKLGRNPDVSVRSRGVMEKCTYCVQRINQARIDSEKEGRPIEDGEIQTACEQACPAEAITFGDINDPNSRVARAKADSRNYALLTELNTQPRTSYLARVRNPNPEMPAPPAAAGEHGEHAAVGVGAEA